jgi:hypothetical protein
MVHGRLSFPHLFQKSSYSKKGPNAEDAMYSCTVLVPKSTDINYVWACIQAAMIKRWGKIPEGKIIYPIIDGDIKASEEPTKYENFKGFWAIRCVSKDRRPGVVDQQVQPITDPGEIVAGYWVNVTVNAFAWEQQKKGVSLGISNVQLVRRDQPFIAGVYAAADEFSQLPMDDQPQVQQAIPDPPTGPGPTYPNQPVPTGPTYPNQPVPTGPTYPNQPGYPQPQQPRPLPAQPQQPAQNPLPQGPGVDPYGDGGIPF